jgi:hypothetical protein
VEADVFDLGRAIRVKRCVCDILFEPAPHWATGLLSEFTADRTLEKEVAERPSVSGLRSYVRIVRRC